MTGAEENTPRPANAIAVYWICDFGVDPKFKQKADLIFTADVQLPKTFSEFDYYGDWTWVYKVQWAGGSISNVSDILSMVGASADESGRVLQWLYSEPLNNESDMDTLRPNFYFSTRESNGSFTRSAFSESIVTPAGTYYWVMQRLGLGTGTDHNRVSPVLFSGMNFIS